MNHEQIEALASVLKDAPSLAEIEIRHAGGRLYLKRTGQISLPPAALAALPVSVAEAPETVSTPGASVVRASMVGVFHALGGKPVAAGDHVRAGQALGHIETMRLMNDCLAPIDGVVERVRVESDQPVEYGQPLFELAATEG